MRRKFQSSGLGKPVKMRLTGAASRALARSRRLGMLGSRLWLTAILLLLAGCAAQRQARTKAADPLFGLGPPTPARPAGTAAAAPVPAGSYSNAALVNGASPTPTFNPVQPVGTPAGWQPGVAPVQPIPPAVPPVVGVPAMPGQRIATYEQAQALLAQYGVQWQRLEAGNGEWRFSCSIPHRDQPAISRTFEGRALTHLAAIQAVLDQVAQERR
jgi:hypothetical protein